jgi:PWWP domain
VLTGNVLSVGSALVDTIEVPVEAPDNVVHPADSAPVESDPGVKDSSAPPGTSDTVADANGTPSTSKRPQNGKRKSSSGVPEHKTKKLNKKKSLPKITHLDAQPGEYYFARLKSYPPWPAIICDEGMLPNSLLSTRPVTTKQADGSYKEAYGDGGKRVHERTFPIMFLHTNEL